jgi:hypothetical protein
MGKQAIRRFAAIRGSDWHFGTINGFNRARWLLLTELLMTEIQIYQTGFQ